MDVHQLLDEGLKPDPSCFQGLRWRMDLAMASDPILELAKALLQHGYQLTMESLFPSLVCLEDNAGHQIVFVPKTGRVQIRIHYMTELEARKALARKMGLTILEVAADQDWLVVGANYIEVES